MCFPSFNFIGFIGRNTMPSMYHWDEDLYERLGTHIQSARWALEDWFNAMEDGSVKQRAPDPTYPTSLSTEVVDEAIRRLDLSFEHELSWAASEGYNAGPGFNRLEPPQRLALIQQLHAILKGQGVDSSFWPHLEPQAHYNPLEGYYSPPAVWSGPYPNAWGLTIR